LDSHQEKEKPTFRHAIVLACLATIIAIFLASSYALDLIASTATTVLDLSGVHADYVNPQFLMYVRLLDGSMHGFQVLMECSGPITLLIFSFISALTIGLLKGDLKTKLVWFILSASMCFVWNLSRLAALIAIAYSFGISTFYVAHFVLALTVDFIWVVSTWALGLSWLKRETPQ